MPVELHRILAGVIFGYMGISLIILLPWWIILTVFTPKSVMDRFFKQPHFTLTETYMLRKYPGSFLRTGIFGVLLLWPKKGKKRQLTNLRGNVPKWYDWNVRALVLSWLTGAVIYSTLMPLLYFIDPIQ